MSLVIYWLVSALYSTGRTEVQIPLGSEFVAGFLLHPVPVTNLVLVLTVLRSEGGPRQRK